MANEQQTLDIEEEYSRNVNLKRDDMKLLRKWVETQFYPSKTSDLLLFLCLHSCYYDVEKAKRTINSYHTLRTEWPEVFKNRDPRVEPFLSNLNITNPWLLKGITKEGHRIIYAKLVDTDPSKYDIEVQTKLYFLAIDFWLTKIGNCEGFVLILDNDGVTWGHVFKFGLNTARKLMPYVQEGLPARLKAIHLINANAVLDKALFIAKIFMNKELHDMIHIHTGLETLHEYIPQHLLPKDYGGDDLTIRELHEDMKRTLLANYKLFLEEGEEAEQSNDEVEWEGSDDSLDIRL